MNESKSVSRMIWGEWNARTVISVVTGAVLFGVLMVYGGIRVFTNTSLTTAMIVPVVIGGVFGPIPAMVTLLTGNILADIIVGQGMFFDWSVGNAVLGFFVGLLPIYGANVMKGVFKLSHMLFYGMCCLAGNALAFGLITPILTTLFYGASLQITFIQAGVASLANVFVLIVIGIPLLTFIANRAAARLP
jgi:energy-coupling factor transport system substrate-specific component